MSGRPARSQEQEGHQRPRTPTGRPSSRLRDLLAPIAEERRSYTPPASIAPLTGSGRLLHDSPGEPRVDQGSKRRRVSLIERDLRRSVSEGPPSIQPGSLPPLSHPSRSGRFLPPPSNIAPALAWKIRLLPVLDHGASKVLSTLVEGPSAEPDYQQAYETSLGLFEEMRRLLSQTSPFLDVREMYNLAPEHGEIVRKVNLATFMSLLLDREQPPLELLERHFLDCFVPWEGHLRDWQGSLLLSLKTQAYIAARSAVDGDGRPRLVPELFPEDGTTGMTRRHRGGDELKEAELEYLRHLQARRELIVSSERTATSIASFRLQFPWLDFIAQSRRALRRAMEPHSPIVLRESALHNRPSQSTKTSLTPFAPFEGLSIDPFSRRNPLAGSHRESFTSSPRSTPRTLPELTEAFGLAEGAIPRRDSAQVFPHLRTPQIHHPAAPPPESHGETLSNTTSAMYRQARMMYTETPPPRTRRSSSSVVVGRRRPWTEEEEEALLDGLDRVKGPHWSQIERLYGSKGLISEALKDRTQVQLKDKARNLKLFFIKAGFTVPETLQRVTGEVKKRKREPKGGAAVRGAASAAAGEESEGSVAAEAEGGSEAGELEHA